MNRNKEVCKEHKWKMTNCVKCRNKTISDLTNKRGYWKRKPCVMERTLKLKLKSGMQERN